jgi:anti-sigma factor RsiW
MRSHDELRTLLPLAAAGALTPDDQAEVSSHLAGCAECRQEFARLDTLRANLARLPSAEPPPFLTVRTINLVRRRQEEAADRRWRIRTIAFLVAFTWAATFAAWPVVRVVGGIGLMTWVVYSTIWGWLTAGCAALILGLRTRHTREKL